MNKPTRRHIMIVEHFIKAETQRILKESTDSVGGYGSEGLKKAIEYSKSNPNKVYTLWAISSYKDRYSIRNGKIEPFDSTTPKLRAKADYMYKITLK